VFPGLLAGGIRGGNQSALLQRRAEIVQKQIRNCTDAIAEGKRYPSLMEKLAELEHDLAEAKAKIAHSEPRAVKLQMRDARQFVEARLRNLRSVLAGESRTARAEIVKHMRKITLTPEGRAYIASGTWDLLGTENHGWCRGPGSHHACVRVQRLFGCMSVHRLTGGEREGKSNLGPKFRTWVRFPSRSDDSPVR